MADIFANLSKEKRIEKAVKACAEDDELTISPDTLRDSYALLDTGFLWAWSPNCQ
jgi:hypothetical protein